MREFRAGMQWEEPYVDINSNSFLSENHRFDEWSRQNGDFINSLNTINELSDYYPPPSDIGMSELIQKVLVEHKIPTDELINELRTNNTLGKVIEYLNDHISIDEERLLYVNRLNKYSHNLFEMNKYDTLSYDGKTTNVNFFESFLNTINGAIRAPELNFKYDSILSSLDSKNPENVYGFSDMKLLLKNIIWDQNKQIYNKTTIDGLKNRLEKNIELYKIIKSITALKKIENPTESQQSELTNLINQAKHILSNKENLFDSNFKYYFDKNNSLKEIERLKKETDLGQLSFENTDLNYVAKQLDENLEKRDLKESSIIDGKIKDLNDKKAKDLLDLKNQQLQLINEIDVGDVSSYKEAIENYSLTEKQINELNKKIAESMKGGVANTVVGYKNFNGGSRTHIVGAENTVLSQESGVIGNNNNLSREATNTFVLGSNVTTNIPNSVALGKDTTLSAPIATPSHTIAGTQYNFAGIAPVGTVSIGAEGKERTLTNLAAGRISNTSTDGINGSQLNAVIETLNSLNTELTTLKNAPKGGKTVIKAGDGLSLTEGEDGSITLSNALNFNAGNGVSVNKEGNNVTITNTQPLSDENKTKYDNASAKAETAVQPDKLKAGDGISVSKSDNGEITITNTKAFETADKEKLNTAFDKSNTAVQPDALEAGNGISINKADGKITITNTHPLTDENKTKYDNASTTANNALEKANTNEGAINIANGRITANEGKITTNEGKIATQEGKINDLTPRVTANEGNITTLTGKVTTVTNTANEALGKANTNAETINNVSGIANEALGKANTAVQPEMLESGEGIAINKKDGKVIISSTVNNNGGNGQATNLIAGNGISIQPNEDKTSTVITNTQAFTDVDREKLNSALQPNDLKAGSGITIENNTISNALSFEGESGIEVNREGDKVTIKGKPIVVNSLSVKTDQGEEKVKEKLEITGSDNIETETKNGKVVVKTKPVIKAKTLIADEMNIGGTVINSKQVNMGNKVVDGVANGEISEHSQQAINGSQIFPIVNQVNVNTQEIHQLNGRVGNIEQRIGKMSKRYEAGLAGVAAMAGVPQVMGAGKRSLGVGVGTRPGANAVAVGYSASSDNGHHIIKTSFAVDTQRKLTGNAGYSYQW